ncbi:hypothetical protein ACIREO_11175 [Streptomyces sp. NPDC102441]|uniref:hypothetical protein n=1 Tax=Streptomyces sp. NPDC102441 TaxID=3366176 RepID=UPI00382671FD
MRPTRNALAMTVTAGSLASALLFASPSFAAAAASPPATTTTTTTAASASSGQESPYDSMSLTDLRVEVFRVLADADTGRSVYEAAAEALEADTAEALRSFLETGRWDAQEADDRVTVFTVLADPGSSEALRAAAIAVLEDGSREALRRFVESGRYEV